jgi:signal transduction histidine kinase
MTLELDRLRTTERWIALVRVLAVPFAVLHVLTVGAHPPHLELLAWITTAVLAAGAVVIFARSRRDLPLSAFRALGLAALVFDTVVIAAFVLIYHFEAGSPIRQLVYLAIVEAAVRYGIPGPLVVAGATVPLLVIFEWLRSDRIEPHEFQTDFVTFQIGTEIILGLIVGWLVNRLRSETEVAGERAVEAERLHDELGRRVDLLEAANRCARALGSSLDMGEAFNAFIRELRGLVPFDRVAIILGEGTSMRVIAAAGLGVDEWLPPGTVLPRGALVEEVISSAETVYRKDMAELRHPEEHDLVAAGLRCRLVAPLLIGARATGMLSVLRREPDSFSQDEIELVTLLGRLVGTAVQNIRAYDAEHRRVEELRRLSALRADFVSLVSHELRSPMAAVIGSARTLQARWRELGPEQREAFLALIGDETSRLSDLVGDVMDTSRIEAGTFSYSFTDVQVEQLVRETVASATLGQDEVEVSADLHDPLPAVRGDRERLRQVLTNLIDNAVKYSPAGERVIVSAYGANGCVRVEVADQGPGIPPTDQSMIFEKFGRSNQGQAKPGTGLGLFIARSIAEAHGGSLTVRSEPAHGAVFSLELPIG